MQIASILYKTKWASINNTNMENPFTLLRHQKQKNSLYKNQQRQRHHKTNSFIIVKNMIYYFNHSYRIVKRCSGRCLHITPSYNQVDIMPSNRPSATAAPHGGEYFTRSQDIYLSSYRHRKDVILYFI